MLRESIDLARPRGSHHTAAVAHIGHPHVPKAPIDGHVDQWRDQTPPKAPAPCEPWEPKWVWLKIKQGGGGVTQVLVHVSTYQGKPFWNSGFFEPQPNPENRARRTGEVLCFIRRFDLRCLSWTMPFQKEGCQRRAVSCKGQDETDTSEQAGCNRLWMYEILHHLTNPGMMIPRCRKYQGTMVSHGFKLVQDLVHLQ